MVHDQQMAGIVMKVIAGFYIWGIIASVFFRWSMRDRAHRSKYRGKLVTADGRPVEPTALPSATTTGPEPVSAGRGD